MLGLFILLCDKMNKNIIIIGITGVGKTTVGKLVAEKLNKVFIDLDRSIELHCGVDVATIFAIESEIGFRQRETEELRRIVDNASDYVLSVGGGCIVKPENRNILSLSNNIIIQLHADIEILVHRLMKYPSKRPLFSSENNIEMEKKIIKLYEDRREAYDLITDIKLNTSTMRALQVAELAVKIIQQQ